MLHIKLNICFEIYLFLQLKRNEFGIILTIEKSKTYTTSAFS